jgi:hypothetical protein
MDEAEAAWEVSHSAQQHLVAQEDLNEHRAGLFTHLQE